LSAPLALVPPLAWVPAAPQLLATLAAVHATRAMPAVQSTVQALALLSPHIVLFPTLAELHDPHTGEPMLSEVPFQRRPMRLLPGRSGSTSRGERLPALPDGAALVLRGAQEASQSDLRRWSMASPGARPTWPPKCAASWRS
jgi:hypothetical protein